MKRMVVALAIAACTPRVVAKPATSMKPPAPALVPPDGPRLPRDLVPLGYQIALAFDDDRFTGTVAIDAELTAPASVVWLHASGLDITSARATQGPTTIALTATTVPARELLALQPKQPLAAGPWIIEIVYRGVPAIDGGIIARDGAVYTQLAPMFARRAFPCIDEPDRKVPWQLTLDIAPTDTVLANSAIAREVIVGGMTVGGMTVGGKKRVELAKTAPLPSYLVAFAVGPFDVIDAGTTKSGVPIRIAAPRGRRGEAAFAVKRTAALVDLAELVVQVAYPYGKLDFVAAPFTGSQPGLVMFDEALLRGGWLDAMSNAIAHQWFGGLVTPRWWDDIWLSEGWSAYVAAKILGALGPDAIEPPFERDEPAPAPPTRVRVPASDIANRHRLASYLSGEPSRPVIDWLERFVSPPVVSAILRGFLQNHEHGVATSDDFIALVPEPLLRTSLAARIDANVARDPEIAASVSCDGPRVEITLSIRDPAVWPIAPACIIYEQRGKPIDTCVFLSFSRTITPEVCPAWAVPSQRTPSVEPMSTPETLFAIAWPQLHDSERARALSLAQGELALRMAERMFAVDTTREIAAWHILQFERFVPDASRAAFDAKIRAMIGPRAHVAVKHPNGVLANANMLTLAALAGDREARTAVMRLVVDPTRVHRALHFALRIAARFDATVVPRLLERVPERPAYAMFLRESPAIVKLVTESQLLLESDLRLELLSGGCSPASVEELGRTSHREVPDAIARVRACVKLRDGLAPAFAAWLAPTRGKSKR